MGVYYCHEATEHPHEGPGRPVGREGEKTMKTQKTFKQYAGYESLREGDIVVLVRYENLMTGEEVQSCSGSGTRNPRKPERRQVLLSRLARNH